MSERERWIVYPLLFLALGAGLRDKLLKQTTADQVVCKRLVVIDDAGKPTAALAGADLQVGRIQAGVVDAQQLRQGGQPLSASRPQSTTFSLQQLMPLLRALQAGGAVPQRATEPASPSPPAEAAADPLPPADPGPAGSSNGRPSEGG